MTNEMNSQRWDQAGPPPAVPLEERTIGGLHDFLLSSVLPRVLGHAFRSLYVARKDPQGASNGRH